MAFLTGPRYLQTTIKPSRPNLLAQPGWALPPTAWRSQYGQTGLSTNSTLEKQLSHKYEPNFLHETQRLGKIKSRRFIVIKPLTTHYALITNFCGGCGL